MRKSGLRLNWFEVKGHCMSIRLTSSPAEVMANRTYNAGRAYSRFYLAFVSEPEPKPATYY